MRKFRVFAKNVKKYLDEIATFDGFTIAVTSYGGIIAYDLKTKTWMQLDPEVYEVCYNTYLVDKNSVEIFENDILFYEEFKSYYLVTRNNISQGFMLTEISPLSGSEDIEECFNWILSSKRLGNVNQVEIPKETE